MSEMRHQAIASLRPSENTTQQNSDWDSGVTTGKCRPDNGRTGPLQGMLVDGHDAVCHNRRRNIDTVHRYQEFAFWVEAIDPAVVEPCDDGRHTGEALAFKNESRVRILDHVDFTIRKPRPQLGKRLRHGSVSVDPSSIMTSNWTSGKSVLRKSGSQTSPISTPSMP
jgi:hypothetical protein